MKLVTKGPHLGDSNSPCYQIVLQINKSTTSIKVTGIGLVVNRLDLG